jgi:Zn-dependent protease with chaperone function
MRRLLAILFLLLLTSTTLTAQATPAEKLANDAAQRELDTSPPHGNIPSYTLTPDALKKGQHLERVSIFLHFANAGWGMLQLLLLLTLGVIKGIRDEAVERLRSRWGQCFYFLAMMGLATWLLSLPLEAYGHWLRLSYGLSVQSWGSWLGDEGKSLGLALGFGGMLTMLLFWIIRKFPTRWWLVFWLAMMPLTVGAIFAEPYVIEPLFNKFEPLAKSNPELVQRLEEVAHKGNMNIPPERMFLMKASEKTTTLNAYVSGFGASKRVVVWDTSIAKGTPDEILFIFGHESGHYVLHHIVRGVFVSFAASFVLLYLGFRFVRWSIRRYGGVWGVPSQNDWGALVVLMLAFSLMSFALEPVESTVSRQQEHAADVYGQEAVHGIVKNPQETARGAFQVLGDTSFDVPNPSQFLEFWTYSHPSIGRRAAFAAHYDPWAAGMEPKYFPKP